MLFNYIDPGAGSLIMQVIIAGIVSVLVFLKNIRIILKKFIDNLFKSKEKNEHRT